MVFSMPVGSIFRCLDGPADLVDVVAGLLEHVVDPLAEADDRVVERAGRLLAGLDVDLQLAGDAIELLEDGLLVVLHADRLVEEPDDGELVVLEVAEDLAGELVERDADLLDVEDRVAGDLAAAAQVGGGGDREQGQGDPPSPSILTPGRLDPSLIRPLPTPRTLGVFEGRPDAHAAGDDHAAAVLAVATAVADHHQRGLARGAGVLVADGPVAGDVVRVGVDRQQLLLAVAVAKPAPSRN